MKITNYSNIYYYPDNIKGLKEMLIFPNAEKKGKKVLGSTVWVFEKIGHQYQSWILGSDVGCGMTAFIVESLSKSQVKEFADTIYEHIRGKGILGGGNHFIDICGNLKYAYEDMSDPPHNILLIHTNGRKRDEKVPKNIEEAIKIQEMSSEFRKELGFELLSLIGLAGEVLLDSNHNTVEILDDGVIYRRNCIKVKRRKVHIMPCSIGEYVLVYTVDRKLLQIDIDTKLLIRKFKKELHKGSIYSPLYWLYNQLSERTKSAITNCTEEELECGLLIEPESLLEDELDRILKGELIYDKHTEFFKHIKLSKQTQSLLWEDRSRWIEEDSYNLNNQIMLDLFPSIVKESKRLDWMDAGLPPLNSMPHGAGRKKKIERQILMAERVEKIKRLVYVPDGITDKTLVKIHPDEFNDYDLIFSKLRKFFHLIAEVRILAYVGGVG